MIFVVVSSQICLETTKILVYFFLNLTLENFTFKLERSHKILKIGDFDLYLQDQISLQTSKIFVVTVKN